MDIERDIAEALDAELAERGVHLPRRDEPANDARPTLKPVHVDPIERQAAVHRSALAVHEQEILTIERVRDITIRTLEADIEEATRAHREHIESLIRRMAQENERADRRVATRERLARSNRAALQALDPDFDEIVVTKPKRTARRRK